MLCKTQEAALFKFCIGLFKKQNTHMFFKQSRFIHNDDELIRLLKKASQQRYNPQHITSDITAYIENGAHITELHVYHASYNPIILHHIVTQGLKKNQLSHDHLNSALNIIAHSFHANHTSRSTVSVLKQNIKILLQAGAQPEKKALLDVMKNPLSCYVNTTTLTKMDAFSLLEFMNNAQAPVFCNTQDEMRAIVLSLYHAYIKHASLSEILKTSYAVFKYLHA